VYSSKIHKKGARRIFVDAASSVKRPKKSARVMINTINPKNDTWVSHQIVIPKKKRPDKKPILNESGFDLFSMAKNNGINAIQARNSRLNGG